MKVLDFHTQKHPKTRDMGISAAFSTPFQPSQGIQIYGLRWSVLLHLELSVARSGPAFHVLLVFQRLQRTLQRPAKLLQEGLRFSLARLAARQADAEIGQLPAAFDAKHVTYLSELQRGALVRKE